MNTNEFVNCGLEFELNNPHIPIEEEIIGTTLYERDESCN